MIINFIRKYRLKAGLTQRQLADLVSVSDQAISDFENGLYVPRLDVAFRLSEALECSIDELFMHWSIVPVKDGV